MKLLVPKFELALLVLLFLSNSVKSQNGLVGYFPLNNDAVDESELGINGILNNTISTTGIRDSMDTAMSFNGVNSFISCGLDNRNIRDTISISAWVKTTSLENGFIVSKYDYNADKGFHFGINDGYLKLGGRNNSGDYTNTGNSSFQINDGLWHHVVAKIYGNTWETWIDCQLDQVVTSNANDPSLDSGELLTIGNFNLDNSNFFEGDIDEVRIYNVKISDSLTEELCQEQLVSTQDNFVHHQKLIKVSPNPTKSILKIESKGELQFTIALIYNSTGQLVSEVAIHNEELDVSALSNGIYWISILSPENEVLTTQKIFKQ